MSTTNVLLTGQKKISLDDSYLLDVLKQMMEIRTVEQYALDLSQSAPPKFLGSAHFCAGQEAVPVATVAALGEKDQIVATYRGTWLGDSIWATFGAGFRRDLPEDH